MKISDAWCRETSVDPDEWTPDNPAWGQCAVTALVVQDLLGGELLAGWVGTVRHYWNRIGNAEVDLTLCQFGSDRPKDSEVRPRRVVLSNSDTLLRYRLLRDRIGLPEVWRIRPKPEKCQRALAPDTATVLAEARLAQAEAFLDAWCVAAEDGEPLGPLREQTLRWLG